MKQRDKTKDQTGGGEKHFSPSSLLRVFHSFAHDRRGVIAIMIGLMFPVLLGAIGLGIEVGHWYENRRDLQIAADAGAIAGAHDLSNGGTSTTATTDATNEATRNGFDSAVGTITVDTPPSTGAYTADPAAVEVSITSTVNLMFTNFFLDAAVDITSRAVATTYNTGDTACVLALDGSASGAILASGTADVSMIGCEVASNSSADDAININGAAQIDAECASAVGGIDADVSTECASLNENVSAIDDPFASAYTMPAVEPCDQTSYSTGSNETIDPADYGGDPVVFCDGLTINATDTVVFEAGTYIIAGGSFKINGGASVTGDGVTFIFTDNGGDWGAATINGGGTVGLVAPTSGDYKGLLFYQDPDTPESATNDFTFNGDSNTEFTGAIYSPNNEVKFSGGNELGATECLLIVALTVSFGGNSDFQNECDAYIDNPIYTSTGIKLVE